MSIFVFRKMKNSFAAKGLIITLATNFIFFPKLGAVPAEFGNLKCDSQEYHECFWDDLEDDVKELLQIKGWNQQAWDKGDLTLMASYDENDFDWDEFPKAKREELLKRGWNKEAWDKQDYSLMSFYNEEEMEWEALPEYRRQYWIGQGYDKETFITAIQDDTCTKSKQLGASKAGDFKPALVNLTISALQKFDLSYYESLDTKIGLKAGGYSTEPNDDFLDETTFREFLPHVKAGTTDKYFVVEDKDVYKKFINVGNIIHIVREALVGIAQDTYFNQEWHSMPDSCYDWAMWIGAKGTKSPMHFDTDTFNFLYVVEGKKRVILIPNDDESIKPNSVGNGVAYTGIDILSPGVTLPPRAVVFEVGAGQGLVIPYLAWHAVENLEATVAYGWRVL